MNTTGQKFQRIAFPNVGYNGQEVFGGDNWSFSKHQFIVSLSRFSLCIRKVKKHENGLELEVSLGFCNSEHINIPKPYLQTFLQNVNTNSTAIDYRHDAQSDVFKLTCSLSAEILKDPRQTIWESMKKIKEDQKTLENALQVIGIIRSKGKISLKLKKEQLSLRKKVISLIKNKKNCQSTQSLKTLHPPIFRAKKIEEVACQEEQLGKLKKGGYFQVRPVKCRIFDDEGNQTLKNLACKSARSSKKQQISSAPRLQKQVSLASMLVDPTHFVKYYIEQVPQTPNQNVKQPERQKLYMDYFPDLLKEKLYKTGFTAKNIIKLSKQLVSAVKTMHQSGIVHRDLKPQNIIIENKEGQMCLKIIDFGESTLINEQFDKKSSLGCTLPYSPIECISKSEIGFNKPEIDLWSVTMILYEMTFRHLPMFYSRCIGPEIIETWKAKKQFSIFPLYRKKAGLRATEEIVSILCISGLQLQQSERLKIQTVQQILEAIEKYSEMA